MWAFFRRLVCAHDYSITFESGAMYLRCAQCGRKTTGWTLGSVAHEVPRDAGEPIVTFGCRVLPGPGADTTRTSLVGPRLVRTEVSQEDHGALLEERTPSSEEPLVAIVDTPRVAAIYAHSDLSSDDEEDDLDALRRYVTSHGWSAVEHVEQHGPKDRPALQRLLAAARSQRISVLVCWRLDRLAHNPTQAILLLDELAGLGVAIVSVRDEIDTATPPGQLQMRIVATLAASERHRRAGTVGSRQKRIQRLPFGESPRRLLIPAAAAHRSDLPLPHPNGQVSFLADGDARPVESQKETTLPQTTSGQLRSDLEPDVSSAQSYRARAT